VEEEIQCSYYLIGAIGEGAVILYQTPDDPLQLSQLIVLNKNDDIHVWLLANKGHNRLGAMVLESRDEDGEDSDETPKSPNRR